MPVNGTTGSRRPDAPRALGHATSAPHHSTSHRASAESNVGGAPDESRDKTALRSKSCLRRRRRRGLTRRFRPSRATRSHGSCRQPLPVRERACRRPGSRTRARPGPSRLSARRPGAVLRRRSARSRVGHFLARLAWIAAWALGSMSVTGVTHVLLLRRSLMWRWSGALASEDKRPRGLRPPRRPRVVRRDRDESECRALALVANAGVVGLVANET